MDNNDGYRPSELELLEKRGLAKFRLEWKNFYEKIFSTRINSISETELSLLTSYASLFVAEINGFLRFGKGKFEVSSTTKNMIKELESIESKTVKNYINELDHFHESLQRKT